MSVIGQNALPFLVGTYTHSLPHVEARGLGIHTLGLDPRTGHISHGKILEGLRNPSYLTVSGNGTRLYVVEEIAEKDGASVVAFDMNIGTGTFKRRFSAPALGDFPCHVGLDRGERRLFVSNYGSGSFVTYVIEGNGDLGAGSVKIQRLRSSVHPTRQTHSHIHQAVASPDGENVLVCDTGADEIVLYQLGADVIETRSESVTATEPGSLPRHLAFVPQGTGFLVLHELSSSVVAFAYEADMIRRVGRICSLPDEWGGERFAAAIRIHPSGRYAYVSNRGHDSVFGIDLSRGLARMQPLGWWPTGGATPRDIAVDPTGRFLVVANQDGHNLTVFAIDQQDGSLTAIEAETEIGSPVCLRFI